MVHLKPTVNCLGCISHGAGAADGRVAIVILVGAAAKIEGLPRHSETRRKFARRIDTPEAKQATTSGNVIDVMILY